VSKCNCSSQNYSLPGIEPGTSGFVVWISDHKTSHNYMNCENLYLTYFNFYFNVYYLSWCNLSLETKIYIIQQNNNNSIHNNTHLSLNFQKCNTSISEISPRCYHCTKITFLIGILLTSDRSPSQVNLNRLLLPLKKRESLLLNTRD
jgi:hypothetical protein